MSGILVRVVMAAILTTAATAAFGQAGSVAPVTPAKSGMVSYIQGAVYVDDALLPDPIVAQFPYMKEGGNLRTAEGRAEVVMNPGLMMRVGENSTLRMISNRFIDTRVELTQGAATVQLLEAEKDNSFTLVLKDATVAISKAGFYHFYAEPAGIKVFAGEARVQIGERNIEVPAGKILRFDGGSASAQKFDKQDTDALDRWSGRRGELVSAANASAARNCGSGGYTTAPGPYGFAQGVAGNGYISNTPCQGNWNWNPYYSMWTYVPFMNRYCDPFWGYCYYNPMGAWNYYYQPRPVYVNQGAAPGTTTARGTGTSTPGVGATMGPGVRSATTASAPITGGGSSAAASGGGGAGAAAAIGRGSTISAGGGKK